MCELAPKLGAKNIQYMSVIEDGVCRGGELMKGR